MIPIKEYDLLGDAINSLRTAQRVLMRDDYTSARLSAQTAVKRAQAALRGIRALSSRKYAVTKIKT